MERHSFTDNILQILTRRYGDVAQDLLNNSLLLQYINAKTKSANKGSKSRSSFGNLYAIYVMLEDYVAKGFDKNGGYENYEGAQFSTLGKRQRELPFGGKLQNHSLNNRMNAEFAKFFPNCDYIPIMRDLKTQRYWFNENLIKVQVGNKVYNIAQAVLDIIDEYIRVKQDSFQRFIQQCQRLQNLEEQRPAGDETVADFIKSLLAPNVDARLFEIVSFAILKYYYREQTIIWGFNRDELNEENLTLYKTGRTNANDGGIDFVMRPLGRFFQVTESLDFKKYFLDIEKIEKYPISFVIKTDESVPSLRKKLEEDALKTYVIKDIVNKYMSCIEEIINIPCLVDCLAKVAERGEIMNVLDEMILQSKVEFNYEDDD